MSHKKRILVVDDEKMNRDVFSAMLRTLGHEPESAADGFEALARLKLGPDLLLMDVNMPGMDGFEVVRRIRQDPDFGDTPIIMVTALTGREDRLRAVEAGANDFIGKPVDLVELRVRASSLLKMKEAQDANKRHQRELEEIVERRTAALRQALEEVAAAQRSTHEAHLDTIRRLCIAAEFKDQDTAAHIQRMSRYCALLARKLELPPAEMETLRVASPMHDLGKIGTPDAILLKPGKLNEEEWRVMKDHTILGGRILESSPSDLLRAGREIALSHHEKWDGSGYPAGLRGEAIPLSGRICSVADVFDALTSDRPYRKALPTEEALAILQRGRGTHHEPRIVDLFVASMNEIADIQNGALTGTTDTG